MLALHHTPKKLVRQVRLELTIPCLRGRCLDPIWLLTHGCVRSPRVSKGAAGNDDALSHGRAAETEWRN